MGRKRENHQIDLNIQSNAECTPSDVLEDAYGLSADTRKQGSSEDIAEFVQRVQDTAAEILIRAEGNIGVAASVYGLDTSIMADIVKTTDHLMRARDEGLLVASARRTKSDKMAAEIKKKKLAFLREEDTRIKRKRWPDSKEARMYLLAEVLQTAIVQYRGDEMAMASALNVPVSEIRECIAADYELQELQEQGRLDAKEQVISHLFHLATTSQSPTAAIHWLKHQASEDWGDKKEVTIKHTGFAPPPDASGGGSILKLVSDDDE